MLHNGFLFNFAAEKVPVFSVNLNFFPDDQLHLENGFIILLRKLQDKSDHSLLGWWKSLHDVRRLGRYHSS